MYIYIYTHTYIAQLGPIPSVSAIPLCFSPQVKSK